MIYVIRLVLGLMVLGAWSGCAPQGAAFLFEDSFPGRIGAGWSWLRQDPAAVGFGPQGLTLRPQAGSLWGDDNGVKNLLVRSIPKGAADRVLVVEVDLDHAPMGQYEQAGLLWYADDDNYVKLVKEHWDGKSAMVMAVERDGKAQVVGEMPPVNSTAVRLRMVLAQGRLTGQFLIPGQAQWVTLGACPMPAPEGRIALVAMGGGGETRQAQFSQFRLVELSRKVSLR